MRNPARSNPIRNRHLKRVGGAMTVYVVLVAAVSGWLGWQPPRSWMVCLSVLPSMAIGVALWAMVRYLAEEPDEFERTLLAQATAAACGVVLFLLTASGFLTEYAGAPAPPLFLVFPVFCLLIGLAKPLIARKYR